MDAAFYYNSRGSHAASNVLDKPVFRYICQQLAVYNPAEAVNNCAKLCALCHGTIGCPET